MSDPGLDAISLGGFFSERQTFDDELGDPLETPRPELVIAARREERVENLVVDEAVSVPEPIVAPVPVPIVAAALGPASSAPEVFVSGIQRAVMDFERFAETFHAFARESQGLRTF